MLSAEARLKPGDADIAAGLAIARRLFEEIGRRSFDGVGYTRAAYGEGEQMAHDLVAAAARDLDLPVEVDAALNMTITLAGENRNDPPLVIGSHLDAVPRGGNFDGLAGVLAGLATLAAWRKGGLRPVRDVALMALRGEENAWFSAQHIGSRALFGRLPGQMMDTARRVDTGRTLREHMREAGADVERIATGTPLRASRGIGGYLELHIEQGPVLVERGLPIGIVTNIRGNRRCASATCKGAYGHSGTVPRSLRRDAVMAVAELVTAMDRLWRDVEAEGGDLVLTFGKLATNADAHSVTTIAGEVGFSIDFRSHSRAVLDRIEAALRSEADAIAARRGVTFAIPPMAGDDPVQLDGGFMEVLSRGVRSLGIASAEIASGAGHDAGDFAAAGIPAAMIFVRNDKGSHNPEEAMDFADFAEGVRLMSWFVAAFGKVG